MSDGQFSIKCTFSDKCVRDFSDIYPSSLKVHNLSKMLVCVESFSLLLCSKLMQKIGKQSQLLDAPLDLEVVLVIEDLRVISFDRVDVHLKENIAFDEQFRAHLGYVRHHLLKQAFISENAQNRFEMPQILWFDSTAGPEGNEEKSAFYANQRMDDNAIEIENLHEEVDLQI